MPDMWSSEWKEPPKQTEEENQLIIEAKKLYKECEEWENNARLLYEYDIKFANGDTHNKYQWDSDLVLRRELEDRPCLTINKTAQHNLMIINDAKQNKPGVRIRPVGDDASFEGAQVYQELIYHIEYISSAENVYDSATVTQVQAGVGYWRVDTDWIGSKSFDQEIYIRRIKDPRSVYLDKFINEVDGSDARYGFIFEDMPKELFEEEYPEFASIAGQTTLNNGGTDGWITKDNVRVCEYFKKTQEKDKLVAWIKPDTREQIIKYLSELNDVEKLTYKAIKGFPENRVAYKFQERKVLTDNIKWYKIAGDRIIQEREWLGKYIPIVRLIGTETVIDGILDRKGHTRSLINAQQIYNYNTSANVEYGALQTKAPWIAPVDAIEGFEEYYKTANTTNHSYLPYNHMGEDGQSIPPPSRPQPPQPGLAYTEGLKIAQNEMMMASGQYQAQLGENENAKSGVAINARQRQGDRATYHFIDNLAIAIRYTGKILIDLIPKIYDTKRVKRIMASDGSIMNVTIDPELQQEMVKGGNPQQPMMDKDQQVIEIAFNPNFGIYDIQADTGPSYATKRMEAAQALTQLAQANKEFMNVGGDIFFKMLDFPQADVLAERYKKLIPPNITGDAPDPQTEQVMHQASDKIQQLTTLLGQKAKDLADKDKELDIKAQELDLRRKEAEAEAARLDYEAETRRLTSLGNSGPAISVEQIQPIVQMLVRGMLNAGEPGAGEEIGIKTAAELAAEQASLQASNGQGKPNGKGTEEQPPIEGARKAKDGNYYIEHEPGKYSRV